MLSQMPMPSASRGDKRECALKLASYLGGRDSSPRYTEAKRRCAATRGAQHGRGGKEARHFVGHVAFASLEEEETKLEQDAWAAEIAEARDLEHARPGWRKVDLFAEQKEREATEKEQKA